MEVSSTPDQPYYPQRTRNPFPILLAVVLVAIVVVGGAVAGFLLLRPSQPQPQPNSNLPSVTISGPSSGTTGAALTFSAMGSGGSAPYSFAWTAAGGTLASGAGSSFITSYSSAGSFTLQVTATDSNARTARASHSISITSTGPSSSPLIVQVSGPTTGTVGSSISFTSTATGGTLPYTFSWTATGGNPSSGSSQGFSTTTNPDGSKTVVAGFTTSYNAAGSYTVSVSVTDSKSYTGSASASISISSPSAGTSIYSVYQSPPYNPYDILVPKGWTASGGQTFNGYQVPGISFAAHTQTGSETIFFAQSDYPGFIDPTSTIAGLPISNNYATGSFFATNVMVYPTQTAVGYVQQRLTQPCQYAVSALCSLLDPTHSSTFTLSVANVANRPDLVNQSHDWFELTCGASQTAVTSAAVANLTYTSVAGAMQIGAVVEICQVSIIGLHYWYASVSGYAALTSDVADAIATYKTVMPTCKMNYAWMQSVIQNAAVQGNIISSYITAWNQANLESIQIMDGITSSGAGWIDALDGVSTGAAGGYTYKIPSGDYGWVSNPGSSSSYVCLSTSNVVPTDCPSGSTPITISAATYLETRGTSRGSQTRNLAKQEETLLPFLLLLDITAIGLGVRSVNRLETIGLTQGLVPTRKKS